MKEQKKASKKILFRLVLFILVVILIAYLIYNTVRLIMRPADTFVVEQGTLNMSEAKDAYVIRNEVVLQGNNYKNGMEKVVAEGKRVAKGDSVFRYYVNGEETIKNEIAELDKQISEAQKNESIIPTADVEILKRKIRETEEKIYDSNSREEIENYKKEIEDYTYKIATIVGELSPAGSYLKDLINKKTEYMSQLTNSAEEITTTVSGTVSYRVDNMEQVLTTTDFNYLTAQFLSNLNLKSGETIENSNEKGKIITDFYCYLAIEMNSDSAMNAKVGDKVKIQYDSDSALSSEIVHINECDKSRVLIFKVDDLPEKMINYRKMSVEVIWWEYTGLKVPISALIEENGKKYVERNRAGYNAKVLVKILKQDDSYAIIDNYTNSELQEMGYAYDEIINMYSIKQFDKIVVNSK
ncbi:MAG: hypothetical protein HFJ44_00675 [Clostridia bacterium]|nr:hypothetical protein [Clostridia bacterium]